jgi:hypothetical protein
MSTLPTAPGANAYLIPLSTDPEIFPIDLAGTTYTITCKWNDQGQYWCLDLADVNAVAIASNIPLITGADCLSGLDYLEIGGSLYVLTSGASPDDVPTLENLGIDCNLYFVTVNTDE